MADDSDIKKDLENLAEKQDAQLEKLNELCISSARQEAVFGAHLRQDEQMYEKIASISDNLADINHRMGEYGHQLAIHISASMALKEQNELIREEMSLLRKETDARISTAEEPVQWVKNTLQVIKWIVAVGAGLAAILAAFQTLG